MTTSEVPTATGIGSPTEQRECGHHQESAAGADQAGDQADHEALRDDLRITGRGCRWRRRSSLRPRSIATPVAIIITANPMSSTVPGMNRASSPPA